MQKTTDDYLGILGVLARIEEYVKVDDYSEHYLNERGSYTIRFNNNERLDIPMTMAQDQIVQPESISEERIKRLANILQESRPKPIVVPKKKKDFGV